MDAGVAQCKHLVEKNKISWILAAWRVDHYLTKSIGWDWRR